MAPTLKYGVGRVGLIAAMSPLVATLAGISVSNFGGILKKSFIVLALTASLALAGCSSAAPDAMAAATTPDASTAAAVEVPAGPTASQFASIISEQEADWREYDAKVPECVSASYDDSAIGNALQIACGYTVSTIGLTSKTAARNLTELGEPPAELAALVARTVGVLELIRDEKAGEVCETGSDEECALATMSTNTFASELTSVLDAWKPYL
ncbi:hypothetical protein AAFM46_02180 [Arthrobacter sp. TMP15]|uniref:hypothetical protein n=1 Tax=Arthrobacter sp. TMP15 TaxID=3140789 RepID=UPI0031B9F492